MDPLAWDNETVNRPGHGEACQVIAEEPGGEIKYFNFPRSFKEIFNFLRGGKWHEKIGPGEYTRMKVRKSKKKKGKK